MPIRTLRVRDLPGYPPVYVEFTEAASRAPESLLPDASKLDGSAARTHECLPLFGRQPGNGPNVARSLSLLEQPGSVLVTAQVPPSLFAGALTHMLSCLTAVRLAQDLNGRGVTAVPAICIDPALLPETEIHVVDFEGALVALDAPLAQDGALSRDVSNVVSDLTKIYSPNQRIPESLEMLRQAYRPGLVLGAATRELIGGLLEPWGALVVEGAEPVLRCGAPLVRVAGPLSLRLERSEPGGLHAWPSVSATLVDARSRKTMERYGLTLPDLYAGTNAVLERIEGELQEQRVHGKFTEAVAEVDETLAGVAALIPQDDPLQGSIGEAQQKMKYQLEKVRERYSSAVSSRRDVAARQIERLCNSVVPAARPQELHLAGMHFVLRYSRAVLGEIVAKMDPYSSAHQQISLD